VGDRSAHLPDLGEHPIGDDLTAPGREVRDGRLQAPEGGVERRVAADRSAAVAAWARSTAIARSRPRWELFTAPEVSPPGESANRLAPAWTRSTAMAAASYRAAAAVESCTRDEALPAVWIVVQAKPDRQSSTAIVAPTPAKEASSRAPLVIRPLSACAATGTPSGSSRR
jgi:hypothetical protein